MQRYGLSSGESEGSSFTVTVMACVKSTSYNLVKAGYKVHVISDCVTSYDLKKLDEMFAYYAGKGCDVKKLGDYTDEENTV